jgi:hypothetical protein
VYWQRRFFALRSVARENLPGLQLPVTIRSCCCGSGGLPLSSHGDLWPTKGAEGLQRIASRMARFQETPTVVGAA